MVALVVEEAHCIKTWGSKFRTTFSEIGALRSLIPSQVKILALTATATTKTFSIVSKTLSMQAPNLITLPPREATSTTKWLEKLPGRFLHLD